MRRTVAFLGGLLLFLAACGDDGEGSDRGTDGGSRSAETVGSSGHQDFDPEALVDIDPCSLLDVPDIQAELGGRDDVADGELEYDYQCLWEIGVQDGVRTADGGELYVRNRNGGAYRTVEEADTAINDMLDPEATAPVEGIGDEAYYEDVDHEGWGILTVRSGLIILEVSATGYLHDNMLEPLMALAQKALDRL